MQCVFVLFVCVYMALALAQTQTEIEHVRSWPGIAKKNEPTAYFDLRRATAIDARHRLKAAEFPFCLLLAHSFSALFGSLIVTQRRMAEMPGSSPNTILYSNRGRKA